MIVSTVILVALLISGLSMFALGIILKEGILFYISMILWVCFGISAYQTSQTTNHVLYYSMYLLSFAMVLLSLFWRMKIISDKREQERREALINQALEMQARRNANIELIRRMVQERRDRKALRG